MKKTTKFIILLFLVAVSTVIFGETLFLSVSPFDIKYGLLGRHSIDFWKIEADLRLYTEFDVKKGFLLPQFNDKEYIDYFLFDNSPSYVVSYGVIHKLPFTTIEIPTKKTWNFNYRGSGFYDTSLYYISDNFGMLVNASGTHISVYTLEVLGLPSFDIFLEIVENEYGFGNIGIGKDFYVYYGEKIGVGYQKSLPNLTVFAIVYTQDLENIEANFGFAYKDKNFMVQLYKSDTIYGTLRMKWRELYVTGRIKGEKVRITFEFPIW